MEPAAAQIDDSLFSVYNQRVELDLDFATQSLRGKTEITLLPLSQSSNVVCLNARQSCIKSISIDGFSAKFTHNEPFRHCKPFSSYDVNQYHLHQDRISPLLQVPSEPDLRITLPKEVKIQEIAAGDSSTDGFFAKPARSAGDASAPVETPMTATAVVAEYGKSFNPIKVIIDYEISDFRDGLQFVGLRWPDARYPHVFTKASPFTSTASCIFPCIDDPKSRCQWEVSIICPKTLGDACRPLKTMTEGHSDDAGVQADDTGLTDEEKALEMVVVCSGEMTDEVIEASETGRKTVTFSVSSALSPNQIGFAVGPFEAVDLSDLREIDEDEKLGLNAAKVQAFCLPGRTAEVRNTCMPMARAIDFFTTTFTLYPFNNSYKMCFIEDAATDTIITAGLSLCSTRLLYPESVLDPINDVTRTLVHALASQWAGIFIVPRNPKDSWVIVGSAYFMTDLFLKTLFGNNDYRYRQKLASYRVCDLDVNRPCLSDLGSALRLDPSEMEFLALKAGLVLFILDRRLTRQSGSTGVTRIINRLLQNSKGGEVENTLISEEQFERLCEKLGHAKLDDFFSQWVQRAGCPRFEVRQSFNKKKLVVNLIIEQTHPGASAAPEPERELDPSHFMREIKEDAQEVWAGNPVKPFKGPMTIRIHEADGTPYEHIIDIKDVKTQIEIPYNTKYKRLKRGRGRKERKDVQVGQDGADGQEESLLYCLGDVLQDPEEMNEWGLRDWPADLELKMSEESYEWIRLDADFEWIGHMSINMPAYMFTSQLQQDRDVVAQLESVDWLASQPPHPLAATFLLRTLMDKRYFHGIRTKAAHGLARHNNSTDMGCGMVGMKQLLRAHRELFCEPGSSMTRPNDFSDRCSYIVQCTIADSLAKVRNKDGTSPEEVRRFFVDKLKFNDNSMNDYSDCFYLANLMKGLAEALVVRTDTSPQDPNSMQLEPEIDYTARAEAIGEIERYRRIDEWISSYQNIFSRTALDCLRKLTLADVMDAKPADVLQYTRRGNSDLLRGKAFDCLADLRALKQEKVIRYYLHSFATEPSPYMRRQIWSGFAKGLAHVAMGEKKPLKTEVLDEGGLLIEQDVSAEVKQAEYLRRHNLDGAFAALKSELGDSTILRSAIWSVLCSPLLSPAEIEDVLDLCNILYDPIDKIVANLQYPRYWGCNNMGNGKLSFKQKDKIRTKPLRNAPKLSLTSASQAAKPLKISLSAGTLKPASVSRKDSQVKAPPTPAISAAPFLPKGPTIKREPSATPKLTPTPSPFIPPPPQKSKIIRLRVPSARLKAILDDIPLKRSTGLTNGSSTGATTGYAISPRPSPAASGNPTQTHAQYGPTFTTGPHIVAEEPQYGPIKATPRPPSSTNGTNGLHLSPGAISPGAPASTNASTADFAVPSTPIVGSLVAPAGKGSKKRKSSSSQHSDMTGELQKPKKRKSESASAESTPVPAPPTAHKVIKLKLSKPKPENLG